VLCEGKPYGSPEMLDPLGDAVRPGGIDLTKGALEHCAFTARQRVLDIGCGLGATASGLLRTLRACRCK
jgi:arsenite methyltransferase